MSQLQLYNLEIPAQAAYRWQMYSRYGWHQAMLAFFADSEPKTLLWHRQSDTVFGSRCTVLTDGRIISTGNLPLRVKSKVYPLEYLQHDVYRFAVELSPRREEMHTHRKRSVDVELLPQWFRERAAGWGFETLQLSLDNQRVETFVRRNEHILMQEAAFSGLLRVTDRESFIRSATCGIGGRRRFGFGLLRLARLS